MERKRKILYRTAGFFLALLFMLSLSTGLLLPQTAYAKAKTQVAVFEPDFTAGAMSEYGYIPSPVSLASLNPLEDASLSAWDDTLPKKYNADPAKLKYQTSVKDQKDSGTCWAFSTFSSLESYLLKTGGPGYNFSEINMANLHGFDRDAYTGGNFLMAMAYLSRWYGPVYETDDNAFTAPYSNTKGYLADKIRKHVQGAIYLPDRNFAAIKRAVREYGAVYTSIYMNTKASEGYYNSKKAAYYCNASITNNHAVTIVGWDDTYSKSNFKKKPKGNGAFLVKNSWGTAWGKKGYFYVSYYDKNFGKDSAAFAAVENVYNYDAVQQYDEFGWCYPLPLLDNGVWQPHGWYANVFPSPASASTLNAVSFYTTAPGTVYQVYLEKNFSGTFPDFTAYTPIAGGVAKHAGYHTVTLTAPQALDTAGSYAIAVCVTNGTGYNNSNRPIPVEYAYDNYSSGATASPGQSYIMLEGYAWTDITYYAARFKNVCLKAFTQYAKRPQAVALPATLAVYKGASAALTPAFTPADAINQEVTWASSNPAIAAVNSAGSVTGIAVGQAIITATTKIAGKTAKCTVTVGNHAAGITMTGAYQLNMGSACTLKPTVLPLAALDKSVLWASSVPAVATVDISGKITPLTIGNTTITATTTDGGLTAACSLQVISATQVPKPWATLIAKKSLRLNWRKPVIAGSVKYCVYQSAKATGGFKKIAETGKLYIDVKKLTSGKTYYFIIRAKAGTSLMEPSTVIAVKTK